MSEKQLSAIVEDSELSGTSADGASPTVGIADSDRDVADVPESPTGDRKPEAATDPVLDELRRQKRVIKQLHRKLRRLEKPAKVTEEVKVEEAIVELPAEPNRHKSNQLASLVIRKWSEYGRTSRSR